ncbi:MAG TPA: cytidine deaminase [Myxococcales bacterium]|jgi:cytidine deaminase|nr:cytidine deaminase [Myxococcales bacterium]
MRNRGATRPAPRARKTEAAGRGPRASDAGARGQRFDSALLEELVESAARIREHAYAPYSRFKVGAAVLASSGRIFTGCNVENCSYGLALCAERAAVAAAVAAGETRLEAAAVVTGSEEPSPPCGMCLQTLAEFGSPESPVVLVNLRGVRRRLALRDLMPHAFARSYL